MNLKKFEKNSSGLNPKDIPCKVLNNEKQSIKIFIDIVMSTINGALIMKFD